MFDIPPLNPSADIYLHNYTLVCYKQMIDKQLLSYITDMLHTVAGCGILSCDASFSFWPGGMITLLSGDGFVVGCWLDVKGLWPIAPFFSAATMRCDRLGKVRLMQPAVPCVSSYADL